MEKINNNSKKILKFPESCLKNEKLNNFIMENKLNDCSFCPKLISASETVKIINKALFFKYSSSQNYYYTREINEFLNDNKRVLLINFNDKIIYESFEENLEKFFEIDQFKDYLTNINEKTIFKPNFFKERKIFNLILKQNNNKKKQIDLQSKNNLISEKKSSFTIKNNIKKSVENNEDFNKILNSSSSLSSINSGSFDKRISQNLKAISKITERNISIREDNQEEEIIGKFN